MKLTITEEAANWYIQELNLQEGDSIKFFGSVYGPHNGFSVTIGKVTPSRPFHITEKKGIKFFVEKNDAWFFDNVDLNITFNKTLKEPDYELVPR